MRDAAGARAERLWLALAALLAFAGVATRVHNAFAYPALRDFDGAGHALNTFALYEGGLPHPRSWSGFHPPLAYALGALVWHIAPESLPVHTQLRLLSALCGALAVALCWRVLRRVFPAPDAALVATLAWCAPVVAIATSMIGNEAVCALLTTATLAWLLHPSEDPPVRRAIASGGMAGAAALAKSTGLLAIAAVAVHYAIGPTRRRATLCAAVASGVGLLVVAPHFARLMIATGGSPLSVVSGGATSPDARGAMALQPPGKRRVSDYLSFPPAALLEPLYLKRGMVRSVPGLLYASTWADGHAQLLEPGRGGPLLRAEAALALGGLLPTGLALFGLARVLRDRERRRRWAGPLAFLGLLALAFVRYTWVFPQYAAVKASYFLPALLPLCLIVAAGVEPARGRLRSLLRGALAALAAGSSLVLWYGLGW